MKVSLIQVDVRDDEPTSDRLARVAGLVSTEKNRDLVVLPELWAHGAFSYEGWGEGEALDGPVLSAIAAAAREAGCFVHAGGIVERNPGGRPFNTAVLFDRGGNQIAVYRKIHLYGFDEGEAVLFEPGNEVVVTDGLEVSIGLATCFDLRFPELFRDMTSKGAKIFVIPAGWPTKRVEHWRLLLRARAIENQAFVLGCATTGAHAGKSMGGYSAIIDPFGTVLAEAGPNNEEILRTDLDLSAVSTIREEFPVLEWRRLGLKPPSANN
ncbi:MAG: nitrilase-related carbon-nitrogen hydrolase [Microvirga sp.]